MLVVARTMTEEEEPSTTNNNHIDEAELIKLHELGFKLVPLNDKGTPAMPWTQIYDDPNYWTHEKLAQQVAKFKSLRRHWVRPG
jgi:hypothetical protein